MADQDQNPSAAPGGPPPGKPTGALNLGDLAGAAGGAGTGAALLQQADEPDAPPTAQELDAIYNIPVQLSAVLGKTTMQVSQLLKLGRGAVVELDRKVGEAIDIYVNNRLVARGEVVVVEERLGITMTEIIKGHEQAS